MVNLPPLAASIADVRSELEFTSYKRFQGRAAFLHLVSQLIRRPGSTFQGVEWLTVEKAEGKAGM